MCERLNKELHSVKRQNQELKNAYDMSVRDYKLACDARNHTQSQLNLVKTDMDSLKVMGHCMNPQRIHFVYSMCINELCWRNPQLFIVIDHLSP